MVRERSPWWVVVGSVLGLIVGNGPVMQFTFGVLLLPIIAEFGWDRGTVSAALAVGLVCTGLITPVLGRLMDRTSIRTVTVPAVLAFAAATAAVALTPANPYAFIALYALMGFAAGGQTPLPYAKALSAVFDRRLGLALGIAMAGIGLGTALLPLFTRAIIASYGWRAAYLGLGALLLVLALPSVAILVREPAAWRARRAAGGTAPLADLLPGLTARAAVRSPAFWALAAVFIIDAAACNGVIAHIVPLLVDRGVAPDRAASALTTAGLSLVLGRVVAGYMLDRVHAPYVAVLFLLMPMAGIALLLLSTSPTIAWGAAVLVGLGLGAEVDLIAFFIARYLGMRAFGELYGYLFAIFLFGSGLGPLGMGVSFARLGSYTPMLTTLVLLLGVACVLMLRMGAYTYPAASRPAAEPAPVAPG